MSQPIEFAPEAQAVLQTAQDLAITRGEPQIAPHVLLAALATAGGPDIQRTLSRYALGPEHINTWLETAVGRPKAAMSFQPSAPHSLRTHDILDAAQAEAREAGRGQVAAADLLVGILREPRAPSGMTATALLYQGATYEGVRSALA